MKKTLCIVLALALSMALLAGCGSGGSGSNATTAAGGETTAAPSSGGSGSSGGSESSGVSGTIVSIAAPEDPDTLSPFISGMQGRDYVCQVIYQPVFDWDYNAGVIQPVVAESYEHTDENHTTIKIRENVFDSEGNPITAKDVAFCINSATDSGNFQELSIVKGAEVKGDYEVEVTWSIDITESLEGFQGAMQRVYVVNQEAYEAASDGFSTKPIGTGPYVLENAVQGSEYTFKLSDNYWGEGVLGDYQRGMTNVETIKFVVIPEEAQRPVALETDIVDFSSVSTSDVYLFEDGGTDADDFDLYTSSSVACSMLKYNCAEHIDTTKFSSVGDSIESDDYTSVCSNVNMRKAIAYAIDVDEVIQGVFGGYAMPMHTYGGNPNCGDYNPAWENEDYYDVDLVKGKECLDKALSELGMTADEVNIVLHCNSRETTKRMATIITNDISKLGISAEVSISDVRGSTVDPTIWDIELKDLIGTSGFTPLTWTDAYGDVAWENDEVQGKYNWCFVNDDKLEDYNVRGEMASEYSSEFIEEARQYVIYEMCYQLMLTNATEFAAYKNSVLKNVIYGCNGVIIPQACTYSWN